MRSQKAVALILAIGILTIISVVATSFMLTMRLEYKAAVNYYQSVKARYLAEAAAQEAIARLKLDALSNAFSFTPSTSSQVSTSDGEEVGSYNAAIKDETSKINIKNASDTVIENLISYALGVTNPGVINHIRAAITSNKDVQTLYELKSKMKSEQINEDYIAALMPYLTVSSSEDPIFGSSININTASDIVLKSVLKGLGGISESQLDQVVAAIKSAQPITYWTEFNNIFYNPVTGTGLYYNGVLTRDQADAIIEACNPNRAGAGTKFCFQPGGYYTIEGSGTSAEGGSATVVAKMHIYDVIHKTTKEDFGVIDASSGRLSSSVSLDCVSLNDDYPVGSGPILDSIKLGFWDDFSNRNYTDEFWSGGFSVSGGELETPTWGSASAPYSWADFRLTVTGRDLDVGYQMRDVAQVLFRDGCVAMHTKPGPLSWFQKTVETGYGATGYGTYTGDAWGYKDGTYPWSIEFYLIEEYMYYHGVARQVAEQARWTYPPGQVRVFTGTTAIPENDENGGRFDYKTDLAYDAGPKHYEIKAYTMPLGQDMDVWIDGAHLYRFFHGSLEDYINSSGGISLYSHAISAEWDDFHVIPDSGSYTSEVINPGQGNVTWGTIAGTVSHSDPYDQGDISLSAFGASGSVSDGGFVSIGNKSSTLQYTAYLTSDDDMTEIPALEDVTITYLPKTKLKSFAFK